MICIAKKAVIILLIWLLVGLAAHNAIAAAQTLAPAEIPAELITRKLKKRNPAFAISVESVLQKIREKQEIILVDVRRKEEFEKFRIPGSINIPLFAIRTKLFLKSKLLVLLNEGHNYTQLEKECEELRKSGFRVWILNGGLNYWREKRVPLKGDVFAQRELNKIPPPDFFTERNYDNWIVVGVSASKIPEARSLIPQAISIPVNDEKSFISTFKRAVTDRKDNPFLSVLIFNERGEQYDRIEQLIQKTGSTNVFYLKGGIKAYRRFLEQQAIIRQARGHSKKTLKKCASCP